MCLQKFEAPAGTGDGCCNTDICVFPYAVASKGSQVVTAHPLLGRKKCRIEQGDVFARCDVAFLCDGRIGPTPTPTPVPQTCASHAANQEVVTLGGSSNKKCYDIKLMGVGDTVGEVCLEIEYTNKWCIRFRFEMFSDEWIFTRLEAGAWANCSDERSSPFQVDRTDGPWMKKSVYVCLNRFSSPFDCCNTSICVIPRAEARLKSDDSVVEDVFPVMGADDCSQYFSEAAPDPVTIAESDPVTNAESDPVTNAESDPVTNAESDPVTNAESDPVTNAESDSVTNAESDSVTNAHSRADKDARTSYPYTNTDTDWDLGASASDRDRDRD
ncbi:hypothetical protein NDN08_000642 [Rhodosorus marinus]|nr:hypothetical protein NDN08_000642 [Rhodosorus marinus]